MPKYLSGRSKRTSNDRLPLDRYEYLSIEGAEPNPSDPKTIGLSEGASGPAIPGGVIPSGVKYQLVSVWDDPNPGTRYWQPVEGGLIPGSVTFYDKNIQISGSSSITQLDWYGIGVTFGISNIGSGSTDIRARIFVAPPGKVGQVLFNDTNANYGGSGAGRTDFSTSNDLLFNSNVGILTVGSGIHIGNDTVGFGSIFNAVGVGTSAMVGVGTINPTQNLHVVGNLRLTGTLYDGDNKGGNQGDIIIKAADDTLEWKSPNQVQAGAGGTIGNIQYHDDTGLVEGAPNFVWIESTQRVGVGSTQPTVLLDVIGDSKFLGNLDVTGISTFTGDHKVTGVSTFVGLTSVIDGGFFADDVYVSAASTFVGVGTFRSHLSVAGTLSVVGITTLYNIKIDDNEIESLNGNLILDSQGGTTQVNDVLHINDSTESTTTDNGSLFVNGGVGIDKNLNVGGGVSISGPTVGVAVTLAALGGITTTGGDLFIGGDLYVNDDIFLDEARVQHLIVNPGVATFHGNIHVFDSTVGIGTTGITFGGDTPHTPALLISGKDYNESTLALINNDTDNNGSYIFFGKQRSGEYGGSTILQDGDNIGQLRFLAADGTDLNSSAAAIEVQVDGTVGGNDTPGRIKFLTTPSGSNSPTERLRIDSNGNIGVNTENASDISAIFKGIQVNNSGYIWGQSQSEYPSVFLTNNARPTSGSFVNDWKRDLPGDFTSPVQLELYNGDFTIRTAASGAANSGITWDTRFIIKEEGNVQLKGGANGHLQIDNNGEFELFEQDTSLTMTNSSKIAMDFNDNVARIRSSHNGSGVNAVARPLAFFMGASEKLRITSDGDVGIGTTNPASARLHLHDSSACRLQLTTDSTGQGTNDGVRLQIDTSDNFEILQREDANIEFFTHDVQRVTIDGDGKILTSGDTQLFGSDTTNGSDTKAIMINGGGDVSDGRGGYLLVHGNEHTDNPGVTRLHAGNVGTAGIEFYTLGIERLRIDSDGNVGIGTTNVEVPVTSNNEKVLAVGVVTAHTHYGDTFYGNLEGGITVPTGDITIPGYILHKDDTDTKFGFPTEDTFAVETSSTERFRIDSSGRFLLGLTQAYGGDKDSLMQVSGNGTTGDVPLLSFFNESAVNDEVLGGIEGWNSGETSRPVAAIYAKQESGNGNAYLEFSTQHDTGSSGILAERLRITSAGDVGIGTTGPQQLLDVRGNVVIGKDQTTGNPGTTVGITTIRGHHVNSDSDYVQLYLSNSKSAGGGTAPTASIRAARESGNYGTNLTFWTNSTDSAGDGLEALRIDASGNVGIGYTRASNFLAGANNLVVGNGSDNQGMTIYSGQDVGDYGSIYFADAEFGDHLKRGQIRYEHNNEIMSFYTNTIERINIDSTGNLIPAANGTQNLGSDPTSDGKRWNKIWAKDIDITGDIDVTGDFNVDDLNVSGIATFHGDIHALDNVGIGTTNPQANFVAGTDTTRLGVLTQPNVSGFHETAHFAAGDDNGDTGAIVRIGQYRNDRGLYIKGGQGSSDRAIAYFGLRNASEIDTDVLTLRQDGTNYFVGIGTDNPETLLDVYGDGANAEITAQRKDGASILTQAQASLGRFGTNSNHDLQLTANNSSYLTITTSARVGVNTTNPSSTLQVDYDEGNSEVGLRLRAYNATDSKTWQISEINGDAGTLHIRNQTDDKTVISIDSSGNVTPKDDAANQDLGGTGKRWNKIWAKDLDLTGEVGLTGDVTIADLYVSGISTFVKGTITTGISTIKHSGEGGPYIFRDGGNGSDIVFHSSNGTLASPTASSDGNYIGNINFAPHDGTGYIRRASINAVVNGSVSSDNVPTDLIFRTGSTTRTESLRITGIGGSVGIGSEVPGEKLDVNGAIRSVANNYDTHSATFKANFNAEHTLSLTVNQNNSTAQEVLGTWADSGGANPRVGIAARSGWKVGIGSTTPVAQLHVYRATEYADNPIIQARSNNNSHNELKFEIDGDGTAYFNGNVGIGSSVPKSDLDIANNTGGVLTLTCTDDSAENDQLIGKINFHTTDPSNDGPQNSAIISAHNTQSLGAGGYLKLSTALGVTGSEGADAIERLRITSEGHVGIGTTNPTALNINQALNTDGTKEIVLAVGIVTANKIFGEVEVSGVVDKAKDLEINATNQLVIQTADDTTDVLAAGTEHYILTSGTSGAAPTWQQNFNGTAQFASKAIKAETTKNDGLSNAYLTFVNSNNDTDGEGDYEDLYTSTNIMVDSTPTTGGLDITGIVTAISFDGAFEGTLTGVADTANHVKVTDNESTNEDNLITFVADAANTTGNHGLEMDGNLHYNPSTGKLTASILAGNLAGGAANSIPYQTAANATSLLAAGGNNTYLGINDSGNLAWGTPPGTGISEVTVTQYSQGTTPRTCSNPITVTDSYKIGIASLSNAYGNRYQQPDDPTTSDGGSHTVCDGDIWYDTSGSGSGGGGGGGIGGITVQNDGSTLADLGTTLNFVGNMVTASNAGDTSTKTITIDTTVDGNSKVAILEDQKTSGTAGGNFTSGAWRDRTLNTEYDPDGFVSLSDNVYFSLPAGTYKIGWSAPATAVDGHQTRLIYATDTGFTSGLGYVYGSSEQSDQNEGDGGASTIVNDTRSFGSTLRTTSVITYFKIQHRCATTSASSGENNPTWGMGKPSGFSGDSQVEVYTRVIIEDLKTAVKNSSDSGYDRVAIIKDQKNTNIAAGSFVADGWRDRDLTVVEDTTGLVNFTATVRSDGASPQTQPSETGASSPTAGAAPGFWSLPAGNYLIEWSAPAHNCNLNQTLLVYSTTESQISNVQLHASASYVEGSSEDTHGGNSEQSLSIGSKVISTTATTWFKIMHRCSTNAMSEGFGMAANTGLKEIYTQVKITDLKTAVKDSAGSGVTKIATVKDVKAHNVNGGKFNNNEWVVRNLNTITDPTSIGLTVSTDTVVFPAGTYSITWRAPGYHCSRHTSRLAYSTNSTVNGDNQLTTGVTYVVGETSYCNTDGNVFAYTDGVAPSLTFTTTTYVQVQHFSDTGYEADDGRGSGTGLGVCSDIDGDETGAGGSAIDSVYTTLEIEDLKTAVKSSPTNNSLLNTWHVQKTDTQTITSTSWTEVSDLTKTVTSTSINSKFLITVVCNAAVDDDGGSKEHDGLARLVRTTSSTDTVIGSGSGDTEGFGQVGGQTSYYTIHPMTLTYLDSPGAGTHTYHVMGRRSSPDTANNMLINTRGAGGYSTYSHMTIQEIG